MRSCARRSKTRARARQINKIDIEKRAVLTIDLDVQFVCDNCRLQRLEALARVGDEADPLEQLLERLAASDVVTGQVIERGNSREDVVVEGRYT